MKLSAVRSVAEERHADGQEVKDPCVALREKAAMPSDVGQGVVAVGSKEGEEGCVPVEERWQ